MRLLSHTIAKAQRGYPLNGFSLKALNLLEDHYRLVSDQHNADLVRAEILTRLSS